MSPKPRNIGKYEAEDITDLMARSYGSAVEKKGSRGSEYIGPEMKETEDGPDGLEVRQAEPAAIVPGSSGARLPAEKETKSPGRRKTSDPPPRQRLYVSPSLLEVIGYEKIRMRRARGRFVTASSLLAEAYAYYLKRTAKEAYEEYRAKGLIE